MNAAVPGRIVRRLAVVASAVVTAFAGLVVVMPAAHASPAARFTNPLAEHRADPHVFKHTDGFYYFTATVPEYDRIVLRRATTIQGLASAPETVIWRKHATGEMGAHIWAPEIHFINGKWYVYFTAGRSDDKWRVYWNADGTPNFGIPVADGVTPVRLKSYNFPDRFVRHWEYRAKVEAGVDPLADSQFRIVTGLNGSGTVSLESTNFPGYYLRHRNYEFWVQRDDGTALFKNDASFFQRAGLADISAVSFEAQNFPGRYLRHNGTTVNLTTATDAVARADSTFTLE